jgi:lipid II:glycine glycyltransferase (peptidoglycan interpeptide bridge formation enzyme)
VRGSVAGASHRSGGVVHVLPLSADLDQLLRAWQPQARRNLRRSGKRGVRVRRAVGREELDRTWFALHLETRHRLGAPAQSRQFFTLLWDRLIAVGMGELLLAEVDARPIAGVVILRWNGHTIYKFGASDAASWSLRPNEAVLWEAIARSTQAGDRTFHFGRSALEAEGLRRFKSHLGGVEAPLVYSTVGEDGGTPTPSRWKAPVGRVASTVLRRSPMPLFRFAGARLYRYSA